MRLKGKKVVILAENNYQEMELWVPYYRLKEEGAEVTVVGSGSSRTYTSKLGYPVEVNQGSERDRHVQIRRGCHSRRLFTGSHETLSGHGQDRPGSP